MEDEAIKAFADALWDYFKPKAQEMLAGRTVKKKAQVTTAPSSGKVGITFPFEDEISVPYSGALTLTVGDNVWVESPDGDPSNYIVMSKGDMGKASS